LAASLEEILDFVRYFELYIREREFAEGNGHFFFAWIIFFEVEVIVSGQTQGGIELLR
jgi:hypothetical protein